MQPRDLVQAQRREIEMNSDPQISAVVPVCDLHDFGEELFDDYLEELSAIGMHFELVCVLDGEKPEILDSLTKRASKDSRIRIVQLAREFGEATALTAGFEYAKGDLVLTLPAYRQIAKGHVQMLIDALADSDVAVATRSMPDSESASIKSLRRRAFHWLVQIATGQAFTDMGCGVRAMRREVIAELPMYGDQYRFFPVLAARKGFRVIQIPVEESASSQVVIQHGPKAYVARLLDVFAIIFLTRFTKKPLRFFGTIGTVVFVFGAVILSVILFQRIFFGVALADRPALFLTSLLVVLGAQIFALGLLGELVIFTHARDMKEYAIERIVNADRPSTQRADDSAEPRITAG